MELLDLDNGHMITPDCEIGVKVGFTSDKFGGYMWLQDPTTIIIPLIESFNEHKGNFVKLLDNLKSNYSKIIVSYPSNRMKEILIKSGFKFEEIDGYECYSYSRV